jgi:hypothetical protein
VLRTKVECEIADISHERIPVGIFAHDARGVLAWLDGYRLINHTRLIRVVTHFDMTGNRKILAERMADKAVVGQYAAQVVMPNECDTKQIECLALKPVGTRPHAGNRIDGQETHRLRQKREHASRQLCAKRTGDERNNGKASALPGTVAISRIIDTTEIDHLFKAENQASSRNVVITPR